MFSKHLWVNGDFLDNHYKVEQWVFDTVYILQTNSEGGRCGIDKGNITIVFPAFIW